jgi:hypothetical protein
MTHSVKKPWTDDELKAKGNKYPYRSLYLDLGNSIGQTLCYPTLDTYVSYFSQIFHEFDDLIYAEKEALFQLAKLGLLMKCPELAEDRPTAKEAKECIEEIILKTYHKNLAMNKDESHLNCEHETLCCENDALLELNTANQANALELKAEKNSLKRKPEDLEDPSLHICSKFKTSHSMDNK